MKTILKITAVAAWMLLLSSCESLLDTTNYMTKTTADFPSNAGEVEQMVTGVYNNLNAIQEANKVTWHYPWALATADECLGGDGANVSIIQAADMMLKQGDGYNGVYKQRYVGIARANSALEVLENCTFISDEMKKDYTGQVLFLRAYYYYELASQFGNVPCPLTTVADPTLPQISGEALWGQIMLDLKTAIDIMPSKRSAGDGHVDKYCAEALLGRVYLFYSGLYNDEVVSLPDGTDLTKADVGKYIKDCVDNSGYSLVPDFHNLWPYSNRITMSDELCPAKWKDKGYAYVCDDGKVNPETMFVIKFNALSKGDPYRKYSNQTALFIGGVRGNKQKCQNGDTFPLSYGYGNCPVSPAFVKEWETIEPNDPRREASIMYPSDFVKGYKYGVKGDNVQETGYYQTKVMPVMGRDNNGTIRWSYLLVMYNNLSWSKDDYQYNFCDDMVLIRFAEVLLMDAEINGNKASFDKVRARAGLPPIALTEENLRNERRWELAFEGVRLGDLRRYGVAYAKAALDKQEGVECYFKGRKSTNHASDFNGGYGQRFEITKGFAPIPTEQINLSAGAGEEYKFKQNAGYEGSEEYTGWIE